MVPMFLIKILEKLKSDLLKNLLCSRLDEEIDIMFEDLLELYEVKLENTHVRP